MSGCESIGKRQIHFLTDGRVCDSSETASSSYQGTIYNSHEPASLLSDADARESRESMTQEKVKVILAVEQQAEELYTEAQRRAEQIVAEANAHASRIQQEMLEETRQRRQAIVEAGKEAADKERTRHYTEAHEEASRLEARAREHFDDAVAYVIRQVLGRE
jgi:vacuolar-type H+-ATPase subunit H